MTDEIHVSKRQTSSAIATSKTPHKVKNAIVPMDGLFMEVKNSSVILRSKIQELVKGWLQRAVCAGVVKISGIRKCVMVQEELAHHRVISTREFNRLQGLLCKLSLEVVDLPGFEEFKGSRLTQIEFIVAPPKSPEYAHKPIHRDMEEDESDPGCLLLTLLLDEITPKNGSVRFWTDTVLFPHNRKSPGRYLSESRCPPKELKGEKGSLWLWDARMLHQSLPNTTEHTTNKLSWFLCSPGYIKSNPKYNTHGILLGR
jgi:hypothetical protein